ncbi:MAG: hypothetical protein ACMUHM_06720 [Thermoplasmatota archaeon]
MTIGNRRWTVLIAISFLLPALLLLLSSGPADAEDVEFLLYLDTDLNLETTTPTQVQVPTKTITSGGEAEYTLSYPLVADLKITGAPDGSARILTLHLEGLTIAADDWTIGVELYVDPAAGASLKIAGTEVGVGDFENDDIPVPLSSSTQTLKKGSVLRLKITFEGTSPTPFPPPSILFYYNLGGSHSSLSMIGEPIADDDVKVELQKANGQPIEEVIPYGPEEARTINFVTSARSAFGGYDINTINILMVSSQGSTLLNVTGSPGEDDGEEWANFTHEYILPEGTPSDTYTILVTAESYTGYTVAVESSLEVRPGLFLTMDDPDREADAGDAITFEVDVLNGGDANDRIDFSAVSQRGWSVDVPDTIELEGGASDTVEFRVYVPLRAQLSDEDTITFSADSRNADRTYNIEGTITVTAAASYGIEAIGDTTRPLIAGTTGTFQVRVINIVNATKTFEMSSENLPTSWTVSYSSKEGELQGSLYVFEINASGEEVVDIIVKTSSSGPFGAHQFGSYVRARGESEKKWTYFTVKSVDDSRDVVESPSGELRKTAGRVGTGYPVKYSKVYFTLEFYNPTLSDLDLEIGVAGPDDWSVGSDYDDIDLTPGGSSLWNLSVTPADGASWQLGNPYRVEVEVDAGPEGQFSEDFEVVLPDVSDVKTDREWSSTSTVEGRTLPLNITFRNQGNRDESVSITLETPPELIVNLTPMNGNLKPGESFTARGEVRVGDVQEAGTVSFTVKFATSKGTTNVDYSLFVEKRSNGSSTNYVPIIIAIIVIVVLAIAGYLGYSKFFAGKPPKKDEGKEAGSKKPQPKASPAPQTTERRAPEFRPGPKEDTELIQKADDALASILGEKPKKEEEEFERVEVLEATIVE